MAKTQEELNALKEEYEIVTNKLKELSEDELKQVTGGDSVFFIGRHNIREPLVGNVNIPDPSDEQIIK